MAFNTRLLAEHGLISYRYSSKTCTPQGLSLKKPKAYNEKQTTPWCYVFQHFCSYLFFPKAVQGEQATTIDEQMHIF